MHGRMAALSSWHVRRKPRSRLRRSQLSLRPGVATHLWRLISAAQVVVWSRFHRRHAISTDPQGTERRKGEARIQWVLLPGTLAVVRSCAVRFELAR
jgi:hypothetical protein